MKATRIGMCKNQLKTIVLVLGATAVFAVTADAADALRYKGRPGSKVTIAGTANIHDWTMKGELISGFMEVPADIQFDQSKATLSGVKNGKVDARVEVSIPVTSMTGNWSGMDAPYQDAMNATEHPQIQFRLIEMSAKEPHAPATPFQFDAKGELSFNGATNVITMPVSIENLDQGKLKIVGKVPLKMTDFKVKPPVKAGIFRTGDEVVISFEWLVALPKTATPK